MFFIYPVSIFICILFSALFLFKKEFRIYNLLLAIYFLVRGFDMSYGWLLYNEQQNIYSLLLWLLFGSSILKSTLLFLYVVLISRLFSLNKSRWFLSFSPLFLKYCFVVACLLINDANDIFTLVTQTNCGQMFYYFTIISVSLFLSTSVLLLKKYQKNLYQLTSNPRKHSLKWLQVLIFTELIMYISIFLVGISGLPSFSETIRYFPLLDTIDFILILVLGTMAYRQGIINYSAPIISQKTKSKQEDVESVVNPKTIEVLESYLLREKPYLESDLTINHLARNLNLPVNNLSREINKHYKKTFFDLINEYRVEEVIKQMEHPSNRNYTLMALAYDCGFNSKTTFYRVFKKYKGITPSAYYKNNIQTKV